MRINHGSDEFSASNWLYCHACRRRPPAWQANVCSECAAAIAFRQRLWRQAQVTTHWLGGGLLEGLIGVGVGALAVLPLIAGQGRAMLHAMAAALLFLSVLAMTVVFARAWLVRPLIRRWLAWALIDGLEIILNWVVFFAIAATIGYFVGTMAVASLLSGFVATLWQGRILAAQTSNAWKWAVAGLLAWVIAGALATLVEHRLASPVWSIVWSAACGRLIVALLVGPLLGQIFEPRTPPATEEVPWRSP